MQAFKKMLYLVDNEVDAKTLEYALGLARDHQASLSILDVVAEPHISRAALSGWSGKTELLQRMVEARRARLEDILRATSESADVPVSVVLGRRYLAAIQMVLREHYDLVLKSADSPGWFERLFSSDDMHLLRKCPCPVWLLQPGAQRSGNIVLAAIDIDPDASAPDQDVFNRQILNTAATIAAYRSAELRVVHAWESPEADFASLFADDPDAAERQIRDGEFSVRSAIAQDIERWLRRELGPETCELLQPKFDLVHGRPEQRIPEYAAKTDADVVVLGTVARVGIPGLIIGNTAEDILEQLRCGVLAIKPDGFESPVRLESD